MRNWKNPPDFTTRVNTFHTKVTREKGEQSRVTKNNNKPIREIVIDIVLQRIGDQLDQ